METLLDKFEADPELWVGVIAGRDSRPDRPVFCAGADLKAISGADGDWPARDLKSLQGGFAGIVQRRRTKPLIAAVHGAALAGGCEIVLACDICVASRAARFGLPEVKRSLIPAAGGCFRLPQRLPRAVAIEMIVTGEPISANRAHALGLVGTLVNAPEDTLPAALALADRIVTNAPLAVREALRVARDAADMRDEDAFALSDERLRHLATTPDFVEGPKAFREKRPPRWTGKSRL